MKHFYVGNNAISKIEHDSIRSHVLVADMLLTEHALEEHSYPLWAIETTVEQRLGSFLSGGDINEMLELLTDCELELEAQNLEENARWEIRRCCAAIRAIIEPGDGKSVSYSVDPNNLPPEASYVHPSGEVNGVAAAAV